MSSYDHHHSDGNHQRPINSPQHLHSPCSVVSSPNQFHNTLFIYILELKDGKYYIGKTKCPDYRIEQHFQANGYGSSWTQKYKPIKVHEIIPTEDVFDEEKYTIKYMSKYGVDNVRGGSFCKLKLNFSERKTINRIINSTSNKCYSCGQSGHYAKDCASVLDSFLWQLCESALEMSQIFIATMAESGKAASQAINKTNESEFDSPAIIKKRIRNEVRIYNRCGSNTHDANSSIAHKDISSHSLLPVNHEQRRKKALTNEFNSTLDFGTSSEGVILDDHDRQSEFQCCRGTCSKILNDAIVDDPDKHLWFLCESALEMSRICVNLAISKVTDSENEALDEECTREPNADIHNKKHRKEVITVENVANEYCTKLDFDTSSENAIIVDNDFEAKQRKRKCPLGSKILNDAIVDDPDKHLWFLCESALEMSRICVNLAISKVTDSEKEALDEECTRDPNADIKDISLLPEMHNKKHRKEVITVENVANEYCTKLDFDTSSENVIIDDNDFEAKQRKGTNGNNDSEQDLWPLCESALEMSQLCILMAQSGNVVNQAIGKSTGKQS